MCEHKNIFLSFLYPQCLEIVHSRINGSISVECFRGHYRTSVDRYWQSGIYAEYILKQIFRHLRNDTKIYKKILLLGLACGSMVKIINQKYPKAKITGVEIDDKMIGIGKKYFRLDKASNLIIKISDAGKFVKGSKENGYDMVISDLFVGCDSPKQLRSKQFVRDIYRILSPEGVYLCNFSQNEKHKQETDAVIKHICDVFPVVDNFNHYPNELVLGYK